MFCKKCGKEIDEDVIICPMCGKQTGEIKTEQTPQIVINNENTNRLDHMGIRARNKWVSFLLCLVGFFGVAGLHKFYEKRILLGIVYLFTMGFFGVGTIIDTIILLFKPNPYYI